MTTPYVPHRFLGGNVDVERVNDNLQAIARDVRRNLGSRYTHATSLVYDLTGITNASSAPVRSFKLRRPGTNNALQVVQTELRIFATAGVTWTLSCDAGGVPDVVVETQGATTEGYAISPVAIDIPSAAADTTWTLTASAASTIVVGQLIFTFANDRGNQGTSHAPYVASLLNALSPTTAAGLNAEFTAAAAAVARDTANDKDLRIEVFALRALAAAGTKTWRLPQGERRGIGKALTYLCAPATVTCTFTVNAASTARVGPGVGLLTESDLTVAIAGGGDPTVAADDDVVTIAHTAGAAAIDAAYIVLVWS